MNNFIDLLKTNPISGFKVGDLEEAEFELGIKFPKIFKVFYETFDQNILLDEGNERPSMSFFNLEYNHFNQFINIQSEINPDSLVFQRLFKLNEIGNNMKTVYRAEDEIWTAEVIAIGECLFQGMLLLGIGKDNSDKIYVEYSAEEPRIRYLSSNIFDFLRNLKTYVQTDVLNRNDVKVDQLYKNWGEDFWRIRPNETASPNPPLAGGADHREERL